MPEGGVHSKKVVCPHCRGRVNVARRREAGVACTAWESQAPYVAWCTQLGDWGELGYSSFASGLVGYVAPMAYGP